jgi:hypothetical protein
MQLEGNEHLIISSGRKLFTIQARLQSDETIEIVLGEPDRHLDRSYRLSEMSGGLIWIYLEISESDFQKV